MKLYLASILVSPLTSSVTAPLRNTMFTLGSSSRGSDLIICRFCIVVGGAAFFFCEFVLSAWGNLAAHDKISHNKDMILGLDWYILAHNVLVLHSCNRLAACDPFLVPFCPILDRVPRTHRLQAPWLDPDLAPHSAFSR